MVDFYIFNVHISDPVVCVCWVCVKFMILAAFMWLRFRCLLASAITKDIAEMQMYFASPERPSQQNLPANRCNGLLWTSQKSGGRDPGHWGKCARYTHVRLCVNMKRTGWTFNTSWLFLIRYDFQYTHYRDSHLSYLTQVRNIINLCGDRTFWLLASFCDLLLMHSGAKSICTLKMSKKVDNKISNQLASTNDFLDLSVMTF